MYFKLLGPRHEWCGYRYEVVMEKFELPVPVKASFALPIPGVDCLPQKPEGMSQALIARDASHGDLLPGEPVFLIRARDNFSLAVLRLLKDVYQISDEELEAWAEWRNTNEFVCKDPG